MRVDPEGFCPCGIVDGATSSDLCQIYNYIRVGAENTCFAQDSMFNGNLDGSRPNYDYDFHYEERVRDFSGKLQQKKKSVQETI
jgi:hypothetical protein